MPQHRGSTYLTDVMVQHLSAGTACFEFMVQPQVDAVAMPVEDPAIDWDEARSPFVPVAKIQIPIQTFNSDAQGQFCDALSFDPWHSLPDHQPIGGVNRVRRYVYQRITTYRHGQNGAAMKEPDGTEVF